MNLFRENRTLRILLILVLIIYLMLLSYFLFFASLPGRGGLPEGYAGINLVPFAEILRYVNKWSEVGMAYAMLNIVGNIVCFIPMGIIFPLLFKRMEKLYRATVLGLAISICVETVQLVSGVGVFDIDDIILNTVGAAAGYGIFAASRALNRKKCRSCDD